MFNKNNIVFIIVLCIIILFGILIFLINKINDNNEEFYLENIEKILNEEIKNIDVKDNVNEERNIDSESKIVIHIIGEINNPGIVYLKENARIIDAINAAGGITEKGDLNQVNLAYILSDGQKVYIPKLGDEDIKIVSEEAGKNVINNENDKNVKININIATIEQIQNLPGIGKAMAERIINYRNEHGKFIKIEDLKNVSGIGDAKLKNIEKYICIK